MTDFFAGLDTDFSVPTASTSAYVNSPKAQSGRRAAHIANGGEATFDCPRCHGTGLFRGYARTFRCNKCSGSGKVSRRVAAAAKAMATRYANDQARREEFYEQHRAEIDYIHRRAERSSFYASLILKMSDYGSLTENQLAAVRRDMAADAAKRAEWQAERDAKSGEVDISGIAKLFATATDNDIKRPIFRADGIEISKAPAHGKNAGALYVKSNDGNYLGKIVGGSQFMASREAPADTLAKLQAVAADPTAEAIKYARRTGRCSCCGKGLVDPVSIRAGIGPICAEKWGLDYRRELAADQLAEEAANEAAAQ